MRVAVVANLKGQLATPLPTPDAEAEFDQQSTIDALCVAIASENHQVSFLPGDATFPVRVRELQPDICFNIAEGMYGDAREAHIPAVLELYQIPYTASRVLTNAVTLDKVLTKRIWQQHGLPTAQFQVFVSGTERLATNLVFPLFVKPACEGSGKGMDAGSIVHTVDALYTRVRWIIAQYAQPALVESYLPGREFTVGIVGGPHARHASRMPEHYAPDGYMRLPILEIESSTSVTPGVYGTANKTLAIADEGVASFICPAPLDDATYAELYRLAIAAHEAVGANDISRVDIRMDAAGMPHLIEINALPGMTPDFSDLCLMTNAAGLAYNDLILEILYLAAYRYGIFGQSL
jgi:D-alanine-D-alanine ligase